MSIEDGERPSQAQYVINRFGDARRAIEVTRFPRRTVYNWLQTGVIPEANWLPLIVDAISAGIPLSPLDFVAHLSDAVAALRVTGEIMFLTLGDSSTSSVR